MEEIINDHINQKNDYKWPLFTLYSLAVWNDAKVKTNKKWKILFTIPNFDTAGKEKHY